MKSYLKDLTNTDVVTIKLNSKEEIITRLSEITENELLLRKPMCMVQTQSGVGMIPWIITGNPNHDIWLQTDSIMALVKTQPDLASNYIESTTGLKL